MKVFTNRQFAGLWPVGSAAVVVADNAEQAADYLMQKLSEIWLTQEIKPADMIELEMKHGVIILCNGDY